MDEDQTPEDDTDECSVCGADHDETECDYEVCRDCGEIPDNCDCEGPDGRFVVGAEAKNVLRRK